MYVSPRRPSFPLAVAPRLESWDAKTHPSQLALQRYLDHVDAILGPLPQGEHLSLALHVGFPDGVSLTTGGRDLDNYLFPVIRRLGMSRFVAAHAAKVHGPSTVTVEPAVTASVDPLNGWDFVSARTRSSASTSTWKREVSEQVRSQVGDHAGSDGRGLELQVRFRVSAKRAWAKLWKPAIDSLGSILGVGNPPRPFMPRDDRIVRLGLHRIVDDTVGYDVHLDIWWRVVP